MDELREFQSEQENLEVKAAIGGAPKIYSSLSSLSNRPGGGIIIFGLDEEHDFRPVGVYDLDDLMKKVGEAAVQMEPAPRVELTSIKYENAIILAAEVPECPLQYKPCYWRPGGLINGSFIRVGDGDRKMSHFEIFMSLSSRQQATDDLQPVERATIDDLDDDFIDEYLAKLRKSRPGSRLFALPREQLLKKLNVVTEVQGQLKPTLAGLLMFGMFPQQFFPSLFIAFLRFPGVNPSQKGPRGERFLENRRIEVTIPEMIDEAERIVLYNMRTSTVVSGFKRQDIPEYPREAVREAIINALAHRDYSNFSLGTHIQIRMFPDRMEISNQGGLYGHLSEDTIGIESPTTRNVVLMRMLEELEIVENRGSGIRAMVEAMRSIHLSPPKFTNKHTSFLITFNNHTLLDAQTVEWLNRFKAISLNDNQRFALASLKANQYSGKLTNRDYQRINSVDSVQATAELGDMVKRAGVLVQHGTRGGAYYTLNRQFLEDEKQKSKPGKIILSDQEEQVISYIKKEGFVTNKIIQEILRVDRNAAFYLLKGLIKKGYIISEGKSRATKYRLS